MTHDELLAKISYERNFDEGLSNNALRAVIELHKPNDYGNCQGCPTHGEFSCGLDNDWNYCPTIKAIERELL